MYFNRKVLWLDLDRSSAGRSVRVDVSDLVPVRIELDYPDDQIEQLSVYVTKKTENNRYGLGTELKVREFSLPPGAYRVQVIAKIGGEWRLYSLQDVNLEEEAGVLRLHDGMLSRLKLNFAPENAKISSVCPALSQTTNHICAGINGILSSIWADSSIKELKIAYATKNPAGIPGIPSGANTDGVKILRSYTLRISDNSSREYRISLADAEVVEQNTGNAANPSPAPPAEQPKSMKRSIGCWRKWATGRRFPVTPEKRWRSRFMPG